MFTLSVLGHGRGLGLPPLGHLVFRVFHQTFLVSSLFPVINLQKFLEKKSLFLLGMTSTVLAQITDELSTNLTSDRELHLIKSAHRIIEKNLSIAVLTDRNDVVSVNFKRILAIREGKTRKTV